MRCIDINSNEIDLNQWEILGEMPFKDGVNVLYLRNKSRTPDQEQIFLVGYRKKGKEKDPDNV